MLDRLATAPALTVIEWAFQTYGDQLAVSTAFGPSGIVLLDIISKVQPGAAVFFVDTGFHFPETLTLLDRARSHFDLDLQVVHPAVEVAADLNVLFPDRCCALRKVAATWAALAGKPAWMTALRRDQGPTRADIKVVEPQVVNNAGVVKISPMASWTREEVWQYIRASNLPYNELHDRGYPSVGCAPCTSPVASTAAERSGRWAGCGKSECGMHTGS